MGKSTQKITLINKKGFLEEWEKLSYLGDSFQKENKRNRNPLDSASLFKMYIYIRSLERRVVFAVVVGFTST